MGYKLLFVQAANTIGGAELSLLEQIRYLKSKGFSCYVVLPSLEANTLGEKLELEVDKVYYVQLPNIPKAQKRTFTKSMVSKLYQLYKKGPSWLAVHRIRQIVRKNQIDLIHTNTVHTAIGMMAARKSRIPHVQHLRELTGGIGNIVSFKFQEQPGKFKKKFGTHNGIIANSDFCLSENEAWYTAPKKMVMHNAVAQKFFESDSTGLAVNRVGMVANLTAKWKRHDLFIDLAEKYSEKYGKSVQFVFFGKLPNRKDEYLIDLMNRVRQKDLTNIISFAGSINPNQIYSQIKLLVHMCKTEPFGRIFIEAMASGVPPLALKGGGASEVINSGVTGFLFEESELDDMADKIHLLLVSENERLAVAQKARVEAEKFLPQNVFRGLSEFYEDILKND